ncbi:hypothetical protein HQ545_08005 [Candidatus Woesearchaeota archaeon]|nr:hypothetical protein [Candidatus Woesearchaeota archaeon]
MKGKQIISYLKDRLEEAHISTVGSPETVNINRTRYFGPVWEASRPGFDDFVFRAKLFAGEAFKYKITADGIFEKSERPVAIYYQGFAKSPDEHCLDYAVLEECNSVGEASFYSDLQNGCISSSLDRIKPTEQCKIKHKGFKSLITDLAEADIDVIVEDLAKSFINEVLKKQNRRACGGEEDFYYPPKIMGYDITI